MKKFRYIAFILLSTLFVMMSSCGGKKDEPTPSPEKARHTLLVYMVATNSLGSSDCDEDDISEMDQAVAAGDLNGGRLVIYLADYNNPSPRLIEISEQNGKAVHQELKMYSSTKGESVKPERMREVISDVRNLAPADSYGLVLWSHGTAWADDLYNKNAANAKRISLQSFGDDKGAKMTIPELADGLPDGFFHYIYFDACLMGSVEVAYELRNKADYMIAAPTETLSYGMPYNDNIKNFFATNLDLKKVCETTFEYYFNMFGVRRSCTISLVDLHMMSKLLEAARPIYAQGEASFDINDLQTYFKDSSTPYLFDFMEYMKLRGKESQYAALKYVYESTVLYKAATPTFLGTLTISPDTFSGLSVHIEGTGNAANESAYHQLEWYKQLN